MLTTWDTVQIGDFKLESGKTIHDLDISYEGYGDSRNPVILLFHARTGSAHAAGLRQTNESAQHYWTEELYNGWGDHLIGPEKAFDTDSYYVICMNYFNSCYNEYGAHRLDPHEIVSTADIVRSQHKALRKLQIPHLHCVAGASFGGVLALHYAMLYPSEVDKVLQIASGFKTGEESRLCSMEGYRILSDNQDTETLIKARAACLPYYTTPSRIKRTISKNIKEQTLNNSIPQSPEESFYLEAAKNFPKRFSPQSFLSISRTISNCNLEARFLKAASKMTRQKHFIISFNDDRCFPPKLQSDLHLHLLEHDIQSELISINSNQEGHDAFLVAECTFLYENAIKSFI